MPFNNLEDRGMTNSLSVFPLVGVHVEVGEDENGHEGWLGQHGKKQLEEVDTGSCVGGVV